MTTNTQVNKSITATPTASEIPLWDANKNLSANGMIEGYTSTVTSGSTVTLTVGSTQQQFFTGSTNQTVVMPVASTLVEGMSWYIVNQSSATVTVESSGTNTIIAMAANTTAVVTCILNSGTSAASWFAEYEQSQLVLPLTLANGGTSASLTSSNGGIFYSTASAGAILAGTATAGQLLTSGASTTPAWTTSTYPSTNAANTLLYASSANTMAALATANNAVLLTSSSGVPSLGGVGQGLSISSSTLEVGMANSIQFNNGVGFQDSNANSLLLFESVASAVNYINIQNAATGSAPAIVANGSDATVNIVLSSKSATGFVGLYSSNGTLPISLFQTVASAVDYFSFSGAATANPATIQMAAMGTDSNININIAPKGTGLLKLNNASSFSANAAVATLLGSLGPTGSHTTVQTWLTIIDNSGATRYIPCF
jgi:hypothetical protein